jgi:hypothetical protein
MQSIEMIKLKHYINKVLPNLLSLILNVWISSLKFIKLYTNSTWMYIFARKMAISWNSMLYKYSTIFNLSVISMAKNKTSVKSLHLFHHDTLSIKCQIRIRKVKKIFFKQFNEKNNNYFLKNLIFFFNNFVCNRMCRLDVKIILN